MLSRHFQNMALFAILIKNGSFTKTAIEVKMTKSRVSQRINILEEHLGLRLINRTTRKISLTYAGEHFLPYCQEIIDISERADEVIQRLRGTPDGKLRIIAPPGFMYSMLPPVHHEFLKKYPQIELELATADSFFGSVNDTFDIAYRIGKPCDDSFIGRFLGTFNRFIVGSHEYLQQNTINNIDDLSQSRLITHKTWKSIFLCQQEKSFELAMPLQHTCDNLMYILQQTLQGSGLAILPEYIVRSYIENGDLQVVLPDWAVQPIELWMIYPSNKNNTLSLRNYIDFVINNPGLKEKSGNKQEK